MALMSLRKEVQKNFVLVTKQLRTKTIDIKNLIGLLTGVNKKRKGNKKRNI